MCCPLKAGGYDHVTPNSLVERCEIVPNDAVNVLQRSAKCAAQSRSDLLQYARTVALLRRIHPSTARDSQLNYYIK